MRLVDAPQTDNAPSGSCDTVEAQLRLTALSTMASTLAHELLQPLTAASNFIQACARQLDQRGEGLEELAAMIGHAGSQTARAVDIIRRARAFVASGSVSGQRESLESLIERAVSGIGAIQRDCEIVTTVPANARFVTVDRIQIEQVLTNLLANAIEALDDSIRRRIEITARRQVDDVVLCVRDFGPGLSDETHARLFEPMFTTKHDGSGLGLPICKAIVEAHDGRLWAERPAGGGAAFCVSLPAADRSVERD